MKLSTFSAVAALALAQGVLADDHHAPHEAGLCIHTTTKSQTVATSTTTVHKRSTTYTTPTVFVTQYDGKTHVFSTDVLTVGTVTRHEETIQNIPTTITNTVPVVKTMTASPLITTLPPTTTVIATPSGYVVASAALVANVRSDDTMRKHPRDTRRDRHDRHRKDFGIFACTHTVYQPVTATATKYKFHGDPVTSTAKASTSTMHAKKTITKVRTERTVAVVTEIKTIINYQTHTSLVTSFSTTITTPVRTVTPAPIATYAACAAENLLDYALYKPSNATTNGTSTSYTPIGISSFSNNGADTIQNVASAKSAYDCCVACQTNDECAFSAFSAGKVCSIFLAKTCQNQQDTASFFGSKAAPLAAGAGFTVSNGKCGQWSFGGVKS
ncbi:hypothetical protein MBLNU457_6695t1 [Dothideomycetes sp. NU457]